MTHFASKSINVDIVIIIIFEIFINFYTIIIRVAIRSSRELIIYTSLS